MSELLLRAGTGIVEAMARARRLMVRGFTMVELLTVVAIVGILAAMAVAMVSKHVNASRTGEALAVVQSIRAAQESYRAENRRYLSVSGTLDNYYPANTPDGKKRSFYRNGSEDLDQRWNLLRPIVSGPVRFVYSTVAGDAGKATEVLAIKNAPASAQATGPYYLIQAIADMDNDGDRCVVAATSFSPETYVENEGE